MPVKVLVQNTIEIDFNHKKRIIPPNNTVVITIGLEELIENCNNRKLKVAYYFGK